MASIKNSTLYPSATPILQRMFPFPIITSDTKKPSFAVNVALLSRLKIKLRPQCRSPLSLKDQALAQATNPLSQALSFLNVAHIHEYR